MSRLNNALLWLTAPALFTLRLTPTRLARRTEMRTIFIDTLSRLMLVAACVWMVIRGDWTTATILFGLLVLLALLRGLTVAFLIARANAAHR